MSHWSIGGKRKKEGECVNVYVLSSMLRFIKKGWGMGWDVSESVCEMCMCSKKMNRDPGKQARNSLGG